MGILVELASCQFHAYFRAGRIRGMGILVELASCQFHAYFRAGRMPTLLLFIPRLTQRRI
ncbi:hypothetical protein BJP36_43400 [Moorena producens JHB]|nr:hypothetical protein [Moorena producens]WAN69208.1 hypothetical protein BJP36_43400 [Moorena producens JHB]